MKRFTIAYVYGSYSGEWIVYSDAEDEEQVIAKMWRQMRNRGCFGFPMAYTSARVVKSETV